VSETEVQAAPAVKVASNLSQIVRLYEGLMVQAIQRAGAKIDGTSLPGGEPMVALAGVAEQWKNARRIALHEERHMATCQRLDHTRCWTGSEDEDDTEPPLQTMLYWSPSSGGASTATRSRADGPPWRPRPTSCAPCSAGHGTT
jgi:hypothetical protein